jgi:hypothetical protein
MSMWTRYPTCGHNVPPPYQVFDCLGQRGHMAPDLGDSNLEGPMIGTDGKKVHPKSTTDQNLEERKDWRHPHWISNLLSCWPPF